MKTLVIGASHNPARYSNMAMNLLQSEGHEVVALGKRASTKDNWEIKAGHPSLNDIHTITLYLNAGNQKEYYDYIFGLDPERVIFNPGAENPELEAKLKEKGIEAIHACTLVMLRSGQF